MSTGVADSTVGVPLRVFLSHTSDLGQPREPGSFVGAAVTGVLRARHAVTHMAYFAARDISPTDCCTAMVTQSDVYVGIIGLRYGAAVRGRPELSYTEFEFEAATARGLRRLIFLIREDSSHLAPADQTEEHHARQDAFRRRLLDSGLTVVQVGSPVELELAIYQALVELGPAPGAHGGREPAGAAVRLVAVVITERGGPGRVSLTSLRPIYVGGLTVRIAFSPDGRLIAAQDSDGTVARVRFWTVRTGQPAGPTLLVPGQVTSLAFSPKRAMVATGGRNGVVRLWNATTGQQIGHPLTGHSGQVNGLAFSLDGQLLASGSEDHTVRLWHAATGQPAGGPLTGSSEGVGSVAFSADRRTLASGGHDGTVRLWDGSSGLPVGPPLTGHTGAINSVAFGPGGRLIASGSGDRTVRLWDPTTGRPVGRPLTGHTDSADSVAFSPDGHLLASGGEDGTVRLWDPATGRLVGRPLTVGRTFGSSEVAFSPDGRVLAASGGSPIGLVRLWSVADGLTSG